MQAVKMNLRVPVNAGREKILTCICHDQQSLWAARCLQQLSGYPGRVVNLVPAGQLQAGDGDCDLDIAGGHGEDGPVGDQLDRVLVLRCFELLLYLFWVTPTLSITVGGFGPRANRALVVAGHSDDRANLELEREGRWRFAGFAEMIHVVPVGAVADVAQDSGDLIACIIVVIIWNRSEVRQ